MRRPTLEGRSILVVEDEPLIAMDIAQTFQHSGAEVTTTSTLGRALFLIERDGLSAAILDHALGDGDCSQLCARLKERGIPFLLYSGFEKVEGACAGAPHVSKPAPPAALVTAMENLIGGVAAGMNEARRSSPATRRWFARWIPYRRTRINGPEAST